MFSGAGGLDLGFEMAGFRHAFSTDWDADCVATLARNRPGWNVQYSDAREFAPPTKELDVLLAGFPCQGFSLGGHRNETDERNGLFREVIRVAKATRPRVIVVENVLNLRNMCHPGNGKPYVQEISEGFAGAGYEVRSEFLKMSGFGVPQTRRRFVLVAFRGKGPKQYHLPVPSGEQAAEPFLIDLAQCKVDGLANHEPVWEFPSQVHMATNAPYDLSDPVVPVRLSRTASDGNPLRDLSRPFPAVDTATIWGWAQGNIKAERVEVDRGEGAKFVRNRNADYKLWRISASRLRSFTDREYARLQTFPDAWLFEGATKRSIHMQVGNAVPVAFAFRLATNLRAALTALDEGVPFHEEIPVDRQLVLDF